MSAVPALGVSQAVDTPYPDSPWVVMKFGGRSVSTAENWAIIAKLIRERLAEGVRPVIVHSALVGVSNALIALLDAAVSSGDTDERLAKIRAQHDTLATGARRRRVDVRRTLPHAGAGDCRREARGRGQPARTCTRARERGACSH